MRVELELKNYRCFQDSKPARILIQPGFTAFVGVNNAGKSSLLKFFYEFRSLFQQLSGPTPFYDVLRGATQTFNLAPGVSDLDSLFCDFNDRDIEIQFRFMEDSATEHSATPAPKQVTVTIPRGTNNWLAELRTSHWAPNLKELDSSFRGTILYVNSEPLAELTPLFEVCQDFSQALYIGPFRNAINVGADASYFDIQVGQAVISAWRQWKTGPRRKDNEAAYKLTDDIKRIFGFQTLEINPSPDDRTLQVFVDGRSYTLPELGSGLTQFFLVLVMGLTRFRGPIRVKRSGSVKGVEDGQDRQTLLA